MQNNLMSFSKIFLELKSQKTAMVIITLTNTRGSAPQDIGARMIVGAEGLLFGTIGGGKVENHCLLYAQTMLKDKERKKSKTWNLQLDIGMSCGGEVSFLFENESVQSDWNIVIFGAGHVAQELVRTLLRLDCSLTVIDNRSEWTQKLPTHPRLKIIISEQMEDEVEKLKESSFVALMTMGHSTDVPILYKALLKKFPYLAVIGSKAKRNAMEKELMQMGLGAKHCTEFICPIGEDFGNNDPAQIAISITAQLLRLQTTLQLSE